MPTRRIQGRLRQAITGLKNVKKELKKTVNEQGKLLKFQFDDVVADWKHKPQFAYTTRVTSQKITLTVYPVGQHRKIWIYVDQGTEPHVIRSKNGKPLRFQTGYIPRTTPRANYGGPGRATGGWRSAYEVQHPGTEAREFTVTLGEEFAPTFAAAIDRAFGRAVKKLRG